MKVHVETERILLRELELTDIEAMFELDSDPDVHKYLGNKPIYSLAEAEAQIKFIRQQYVEFGIGRWAIIDKATNQFVGWGGLKFRTDVVNNHSNYYDVGYRLIQKFWGKGYATESAKASIKYAFEVLGTPAVYAMALCDNKGSINALQKSGLRITTTLDYEGEPCYWFELSKEDWLQLPK